MHCPYKDEITARAILPQEPECLIPLLAAFGH